MRRRDFIPAAAAALAAPASYSAVTRKDNIKQSVCKWCYKDMSVEDLARHSARLGIKGMDLIGPDDWPAVLKHGIVPTMAPGAGSIAEGTNRVANHAAMEKAFKESITKAAAAKVPNVITFSGPRKGMSDQEGLDNSVLILNKVKAFAEDKGVTICLELLNSKIDHKDYMADHTLWGAELIKRVASPRVKLLYDIYHMQIMEGDVIRTIRDNFQYIGHYHTGGVPGRNEIDAAQELNYKTITRAIIDLGFKGYMAHEFIPKRDPVASLAEAAELCDV